GELVALVVDHDPHLVDLLSPQRLDGLVELLAGVSRGPRGAVEPGVGHVQQDLVAVRAEGRLLPSGDVAAVGAAGRELLPGPGGRLERRGQAGAVTAAGRRLTGGT